MSKVVIPYHPRPYQVETHRELDRHRFSVLVFHRRAGKTVLAVNQLIKRAATCALPRGRYAYVAPLLSQAKMIAWDYAKHYTAPIPGRKVNESELTITLPNDAHLRLFGADNPDALRGGYWDGVVFDEWADARRAVWEEVVRPALSDRQGWAIFLGTPKGMDQFYEILNVAKNAEGWYQRILTVDDTGIISRAELESARETMTEAQFRQEFYCDFNASRDDVYIPLDLVEPALGRHLREEQYNSAPVILGVDIARFGDDDSVIFKRQGLASFLVGSYSQRDTTTMAGLIAQAINDHQPDGTFIDLGYNPGVYDLLVKMGTPSLMGVNFGGAATIKESLYSNKRAEMWGQMREWLTLGGCLPDVPHLAAQISGPTYSFDVAQRLKLESKESMKKRGLKSPDLADALALTFAFPVSARRRAGDRAFAWSNGQQFASSDYDPESIY